ncbi:MAG: hypothetical protein ACO2ZD_00605 [Pseudomonadales bacterium]
MLLFDNIDYFKGFVPHIQKIDFDHPVFDRLVTVPRSDEDYANCTEAAKNISRQLLGLGPDDRGFSYYKSGEHPLYTELQVLREMRRDNWATESPHGVLAYVHGLRALKLMFPQTDITPPLADVVYLSMGMFSFNRKNLNLIGSMDAGKSSSTARLSWLYAAIDPERTFVNTATPTQKSAQSTIFGDMTELYSELLEAGNQWLFPDARVLSDKQIELFKGSLNSKGGWMMHRSFKSGGVSKGSKGKGKDTRYGVGLYIADEINEIEHFERFKRDFANTARNPYFQLQTSQNPKDEQDEGGLLCEPKAWQGWGVDTYKEVREADLLIWPSVQSGITYRFDGLRGVNLTLGKTVYPYLLNPMKHQGTIDDYGADSPEYMSQIRAMFAGEQVQRTLLSRTKLASSRHTDTDYTVLKVRGRGLGIDPAHTGLGDKAVITVGYWADCILHQVDGEQEDAELLVIEDQIAVKVLNNFKWDDRSHFLERFIALGGDLNSLTLGSPVTYEQQIALEAAQLCKDKGIPYKNVCYDFSLRPDTVSAMNMVMGFDPIAHPGREKPKGFQLIDTRENTETRARTCAEEALFLAADVIAGKALRGGDKCSVAALQLSRRWVLHDRPGMPVEKKIDFKARNGGRSPDHCDSLAYFVWLAYLRGFRAESPIAVKTRGKSLFAKQERRTPRFKRLTH